MTVGRPSLFRMKKIYIALAAVFAALTALMIIYRVTNPPKPSPTADYTRVKAELLLHNYRQSAEENSEAELQNVADHSVIYAVMVETPVNEAGSDVSAEFTFFDYLGGCTHMRSDNSGYFSVKNGHPVSETAKSAVEAVRGYFDETFSRAKKSSYDVPHDGEVKIYVRAGDGVFYKTYKTEDAPEELVSAYADALAIIAGTAESQTE